MKRDRAPVATYLLALTGILSLLLAEGTEALLLWVGASCLLCWALLEPRTSARLPRALARATDLLAATSVVGLAVTHFAFGRASLQTLAHVLVVTQLSRAFRKKSFGDIGVMNGTAMAQIALAAFLSESPAFVLVLGLALVFGVGSSLAALEMARAPTGDARLFVNRPRGRAGLRSRVGALFVPAVLIFAVFATGAAVFVILPRGGPFRGHDEVVARPRVYDPGEDEADPDESGNRITGFSEQVKLGDLGRIKMVPWQAFLVQFQRLGRPTRIPDWLMYFRGLSLDTFDGRQWSRSPELRAGEKWLQLTTGLGTLPLRQGVPTTEAGFRRIHQEYWLKQTTTRVLFALDAPVSIDLTVALPHVRAIGDGSYLAPEPHDEGFSYRVSSVVPADPEKRILLEDLSPVDRERLLWLPAECAAVAATGKSVAGEGEAHVKAGRLRDWLRDRCSYTLIFTDDPRGTPLDDFLYRTRAGHCEYFASALAVLLRGAGVPSRLVIGYRGGQWFEDDEMYLVRQSDAHAWVEAFCAGRGWIRLDATPPDDQAVRGPTVMIPGVLPPTADGLEPAALLSSVRDFGPGDREAVLTFVTDALGFVVREGFGPGRRDRRFPPPLLVLAGLALVLWAGRRLLGVRLGSLRRGRGAATVGGHRASAPPSFYAVALRALAARGMARGRAQSPREFLGSSLATLGDAGTAFRELTSAFESVRYGGARLSGVEADRLLRLAESLAAGAGQPQS